jgi:tetratricopeptide (TPR) repeat protein
VAESAASQFEFGRGDIAAALAHAERALSLQPAQATLLLNVAYLHLRRSEYTAALDLVEHARRVAPDSPEAAKLAGWADYGLSRLPQAIAEWKRAQQLRPDDEVGRALEKAERDAEVETNFREGESAHFALRYSGGAAPDLARGILGELENSFQVISSLLNYTPAEPIAVVLYTDQDFADITRAPSWAGALNDGRIRIPVQGLLTVTPQLARVLRHELGHSFISQKTHGNCAVWLQEGIAEWLEGARVGDDAAALVAMYDRRDDPSLAALEGSWLNLPNESAHIAYAWSLAVVEGIVQAGTSVDLERLLDGLAAGSSTEAATRNAVHMNYTDLNRSTVEYLRRTYLH